MEPTLGQIKEYIRKQGIELHIPTEKSPTASGNVQLYGDIAAETYFQYYLEHSVEIHEWLTKGEKEKENGFHK